MDGTQILTLGLGFEAPWILKGQNLDTSESPHRLGLHVEAECGSLYPCPECSKACPAHDFTTKTWRHLNFFQHHCYNENTFLTMIYLIGSPVGSMLDQAKST